MRAFPVCKTLAGFLFAVVAASSARAQTNLIHNSSFDQKGLSEYYLRAARDNQDHKLLDSHGGVFTEVIPGNQCYRIDLDRYVTDAKGRKTMHPILAIGGGRGYDLQDGRKAMKVEPNTTYAFSVEMRGTVNKAGFSVTLYHGKDVGYDSITRAKASPGGVTIGKDWTTYQGTFKTGPDTNRATLMISLYTSEQYGLTEKPGTYLLIDNISIQKKKSPLAALSAPADAKGGEIAAPRVAAAPLDDSAPQLDGKLDDSVWQSGDWQSGFRYLKKDAQASVQTRYKLSAGKDALYLAVACDEPALDQLHLKATKNGQPVYADDCVELLVDNGRAELPIRQYIVNASAIRQMLWVGSSRSASAAEYETWSAATGRTEKGWTLEVKLPWKTLGLNGRPGSGTALKFNVCRDRYAGEAPEHTSWSYASGNFRDPSHFGVMVVGTLADNMKQRIAGAEKALAAGENTGGKASVWADLKERLAKLKKETGGEMTGGQWADAYSKLEAIRKGIDVAPLGTRPFVVTQVSPTARFTIPFIPQKLSPKPEAIRLHAAVNEFESLPIAITNLTDRTESYRVVLYAELEKEIPVPGLKGKDGKNFPADQIHQFEAIRVKNDDSPNPGQQFDVLAPAGIARTITVPPRESGVAWFTFDCRTVQPGTYTGTLRVIPLSAPGKYVLKKGWQFEGALQEIPVSLDIWPITLPQASPIPVWLMDPAQNFSFFKDMAEHGNTIFQLSPWAFRAKFDKEGNITEAEAPSIAQTVRDCNEWAKRMKLDHPPRQIIAFSVYKTTYNQWMGKKFKVGSPQWERAVTQYFQFIEKTMMQAGLAPGSYDVELWDEPHLEDQADVVASLRVVRQACPKMKLNITLGASRQTPQQILEMAPYASTFCFWGSYWSDPVYPKLMQTLRDQGKEIWQYICDTNPRVDLYRYYRLFAWDGWTRDVACLGLFDYINGPGGFYGAGSWKTTPFGALVYNAGGQPVDSIRFEAMREGLDDIKYLAVLKQAIAKAPDAAAAKEATEFLKTVPARVVGSLSHDMTQANQARAKAAALILRLEGK